MAKVESMQTRTDGLGRQFLCEARSPDGWHIEVFGPNQHCQYLYAYARHPHYGLRTFGIGREPAEKGRIRFRWDLPNGAWAVFIDDDCWAICVQRPALRPHQVRIHARGGERARPYSEDEVRFLCAKRRGQQKGTKGIIIED